MDNKKFQHRKTLSLLTLLFTITIGFAQIKTGNGHPDGTFKGIIKTYQNKNQVNSNDFVSKSLKSNQQLLTQEPTYWQSKGYGYFAIIFNDTTLLYDVTECSRSEIGLLIMKNQNLFYNDFPVATYEYRDTMFIVNIGKDMIFYQVDSVPAVLYDSSTTDPIANFEVFWHIFKENYSFFSLAHINWDYIYTVYRPMITDTTTDEVLFSVFSSMLEPLRDRHIMISDTLGTKFYTPGPDNYNFWYNEPIFYFDNIINRLDNQEYYFTANDYIYYGKINRKIGYINISSMFDYYSSDNYIPDEEIISQVMDTLVEKFDDCESIIVDIRINGGGRDLVSFEIASRFNDQQRVGYYRSYRVGGYEDFSEPVPFYTYTSDKNFGNKKTVLLTSNHAYSSADVFAMIMKDIPNVTLLGEHTYGVFSDVLSKLLPNGWVVDLSNERYYSSEQINYEQIGIYPDIELEMDSVSFFNGTDNVLEKAIELLSVTDIDQGKSEPVALKVMSNPFADRAVIDITLPENEAGEITIVDMLGKVICHYRIMGSNTIAWNAGNNNEGIYFCILKTERTYECLKLSHIK